VILRLLTWLARACTIAGALALAVMMLGTDWDILARQLAGRPLTGVVELVEITVLATAMLGLPEGFLRDEQIHIDLLDSLLPRAVLRGVKAAGLLLSMLFLVLLCRNIWQPMLDARMFGDVKYDLGVPVWPLYALMLFAFAASVLTCAALFWIQVAGGKIIRGGAAR
jgi:TRAP-type C4-dicarboxylate transport system permease small subunit